MRQPFSSPLSKTLPRAPPHSSARGVWLLVLALMGGCGGDPASADMPSPTPSPPVLPVGLSALPSPADNPLTPEAVELGRWLFYSPLLSRNGQVACASCHVQAHAFSLDAPRATIGISGHPLARHTPALINLAWEDGLFWDGGARNLESLSLAPLTNADEMGQSDLQALMDRLAATPDAIRRFEAAYGPRGLSMSHLLRALAQFQRTLVSARSRYDQWRRGEPGARLSALEQAGLEAVQQRCTPCHGSELFTDNSFHNNGLDTNFGTGEDVTRGRGRISLEDQDTGLYKTPTLRNVARSAPYMHDGRFATLDAVLEHYRHGMVDSPTLDPAFRHASSSPGLPLTDMDKAAILAFLDALTDEAFLTDPSLGPPP